MESPTLEIQEDANGLFNQLWQIYHESTHNPSPTPVTLRRRDLDAWSNRGEALKYVVAEKNDGARASVLFGRTNNTKEECYTVLIQRNREMVMLPTAYADEDLFDGTLLDGEWMESGAFRIFDVVSSKGYSKKKKTFPERLKEAERIIKLARPDGWSWDVKTFWPLSAVGKLQERIQQGALGRSDGLIFMPINDPITTGRAENMKKWKPTPSNTIDLEYSGQEWQCIGADNTPVKYDVVLDGVHHALGIFELSPLDNGKRWRVKMQRDDKTVPNHINTILKTIDTIREDIDLEEIITIFQE